MKRHAYAIQVLGGVLCIHETQLGERERESHADDAENRYRECCLRNLRMQIAELRAAIGVLEGDGEEGEKTTKYTEDTKRGEGEEVTTKGAKYAKGEREREEG